MDTPSRGRSGGGPGREARQRSSRKEAEPSEKSARAGKRRKLEEEAEPNERSVRFDRRQKLERCISFFREYDEKTNRILAPLLGGLEHLDGGVKKLGLDSKKKKELGFGTQESIDQMDYDEERAGIADSTIPYKIGQLENMRTSLNEEYENDKTAYAKKEIIPIMLVHIDNRQKYLNALKEALQEQYETLGKEVKKYKDQRNVLRGLDLNRLQRALEEQNQHYHTFAQSVSPEILELAVKRYEAELDPNVISPLILSKANKLVELASETVFDKIIAKKQELQKRAAEDAGLEDYDSYFFLKSQRDEIDYDSQHPGLAVLQQWGRMGCGVICTQMVAADENKHYLNYSEEMLGEFERLPLALPVKQGLVGVLPAMIPKVLSNIGHSTPYEYVQAPDIFSQKFAGFQLHQEYSSYTILHSKEQSSNEPASEVDPATIEALITNWHNIDGGPRNITVDQFRDAIGQGKPIIAWLQRTREDRKPGTAKYSRSHIVVADIIVRRGEEAHVHLRNPEHSQGYSVPLKDFLEVWDGRACIPREQTSP